MKARIRQEMWHNEIGCPMHALTGSGLPIHLTMQPLTCWFPNQSSRGRWALMGHCRLDKLSVHVDYMGQQQSCTVALQ